jgi:hypothetical protein
MSEMPKEMKDRYAQEASDHADFLCSKVFKPAFEMAFIHGAKHARADVLREMGTKTINEMRRKDNLRNIISQQDCADSKINAIHDANASKEYDGAFCHECHHFDTNHSGNCRKYKGPTTGDNSACNNFVIHWCCECCNFDVTMRGNCRVTGYGTKATNRSCDRFDVPPVKL